jgi:hypothetical protein
MSTPNAQADVITAAMSIAKDVAEGRVDPSALQQQAVTECRDLFATVAGEGDPLWTLHADVARQAIALGAERRRTQRVGGGGAPPRRRTVGTSRPTRRPGFVCER